MLRVMPCVICQNAGLRIPSVILYAINMLVYGNTGILKTKSRIKTQSKASTLITILVTILADQLPKRYQDGLIKLVI